MAALVLSIAMGALAASCGLAAAPPALVRVGQTYIVVYDCLPGPLGCYGELWRVEAVRQDGWVEVTQCQAVSETRIDCPAGSRWWGNLARVTALKPYTAGRAAD